MVCAIHAPTMLVPGRLVPRSCHHCYGRGGPRLEGWGAMPQEKQPEQGARQDWASPGQQRTNKLTVFCVGMSSREVRDLVGSPEFPRQREPRSPAEELCPLPCPIPSPSFKSRSRRAGPRAGSLAPAAQVHPAVLETPLGARGPAGNMSNEGSRERCPEEAGW